MSNGAENTGRVFVFGSANNDHVLAVEEFPQAGETVLSRSYSVGLGGKGANQAVAAASAAQPLVAPGSPNTGSTLGALHAVGRRRQASRSCW